MNETATTTEAPEEECDCESCGDVVKESHGADVQVRAQTWEEPAEYVFVCDACNGEPDAPEPDDYYYDDPALDYAHDPFSD